MPGYSMWQEISKFEALVSHMDFQHSGDKRLGLHCNMHSDIHRAHGARAHDE